MGRKETKEMKVPGEWTRECPNVYMPKSRKLKEEMSPMNKESFKRTSERQSPMWTKAKYVNMITCLFVGLDGGKTETPSCRLQIMYTPLSISYTMKYSKLIYPDVINPANWSHWNSTKCQKENYYKIA